ncbi:hypothetical protein GCM10020216_096920 [Nonomuraea helvata]
MVLVDPGGPRLYPFQDERLVVRAPGDEHVEPPAEQAGPLLADPLTEKVASRGDRSHLRHVTYSNQSIRISKAFPC